MSNHEPLIEGELFLHVKEGVEITKHGSFGIYQHVGSNMSIGYSKWPIDKSPDDGKFGRVNNIVKVSSNNKHVYECQSSNDADNIARYEHILCQLSGKVLICGVGGGSILLVASDIEEVTSITAVDLNLGAIQLYKNANYPNADKINFYHGDAYDVSDEYDWIVFDVWPPKEKQKLKAKSKNPIQYPDWHNWQQGNGIDIINRPWPRYFDLNDPALLATKERIERLNVKIDAQE